jgi:tetratricopeptide (TPR) repeat protein
MFNSLSWKRLQEPKVYVFMAGEFAALLLGAVAVWQFYTLPKDAPEWPHVLWICTAVVFAVLVAAVFPYLLRQHDQGHKAAEVAIRVDEEKRSRARQEEDSRAARLSALLRHYPPRTIGGTDPYDDGLDYPSGVARRHYPQGIPPYIPRDWDDLVCNGLRTGFALIVGPSGSGKSRTAFEAIKRTVPTDHRLVIPEKQANIGQILGLLKKDELGPLPAVLWLDDVHNLLRGDLVDRGTLNSCGPDDLWIMATIWDEELLRMEIDKTKRSAPRLETLASAARIRVYSSGPSPGELESAAEAYPGEDFANGIAERLKGERELLARMQLAIHESPEALAVVRAALDWNRCGMLGGLPQNALNGCFGEYVRDHRSDIEPTPSLLADGVSWACMPIIGEQTALIRVDWSNGKRLELSDLIVYHASTGSPEIPPVARSVHPLMWRVGLEYGSLNELTALGSAAYNAKLTEIAREAFERLAAEDVPEGAYNLGILLRDQGDSSGAERALLRGMELGYGAAASNYGYLLHERGNLIGAEAAYRRGIELGSGQAAHNLALLLSERGDEDGAEEAYRMASEMGSASSAFNLGLLSEARGALSEAEHAYQKATELGDGEAALRLGGLLENRGDKQRAKTAWVRSLELGNGDAAANLGLVQQHEGNFSGAVDFYQQGIGLGSGHAALNLGILLHAKGDYVGAETAWRRGVDLGSITAAEYLVSFFNGRGNLESANEFRIKAEELRSLAG